MVKEIQKKNKNKKNIKNQYIYTGCQIINKTLFDKFLSKNFYISFSIVSLIYFLDRLSKIYVIQLEKNSFEQKKS